MRTKMRLIVAPVALIFGIGAMVLTTESANEQPGARR
jgi:hypothetical protein